MLLSNGYRSLRALRKQPPYNKGEVFGVPEDIAQALMAPVPDKDGGPWAEDWPHEPPTIVFDQPNAVGQAFVLAERQNMLDRDHVKTLMTEIVKPLTQLITVQQEQLRLLAAQQQQMALLMANMQGKGDGSD